MSGWSPSVKRQRRQIMREAGILHTLPAWGGGSVCLVPEVSSVTDRLLASAAEVTGRPRLVGREAGIVSEQVTKGPACLAFSLIADYAIWQGWTPIGFRHFRIGPWQVTVNGTRSEQGGISPYHAHIAHDDLVGLMVINPFGGSVGGSEKTEDSFIAAMEAALGRPGGCHWTEDTDGGWDGSCGAAWVFECDGPIENKMRYCPSCGKALVV